MITGENKAKSSQGIADLAGRRRKSQRKLILDLIHQAEGHLDADELFRRAKDKEPRISFSTVYRNLQLFKKLGLVEERHFAEEHHLPNFSFFLQIKCISMTEINNRQEGHNWFLAQLGVGEMAAIVAIGGGRGLRQKLYLRGLMEGKVVRVISNFGGPVTVEVDRNAVAIGRGMAQKILVRKC